MSLYFYRKTTNEQRKLHKNDFNLTTKNKVISCD